MIGLISINYKTAPLEIREKFYFDSTEKNNFHKTLLKEYSLEGLMILSTCNRTEIYFEFENHTGEIKKIFHGIMKSLVEFKKYNEGFAENYIEMLRAGGTLRHKELLKPFNLDASDSAFWAKGLSMVESFIDQLDDGK